MKQCLRLRILGFILLLAIFSACGGNGANNSGGSNPTAAINANPNPITDGQSTTITWSSTNASSCTGTGFSTGNATSGSVQASPTTTTTYTVNCGGAVASVSVTVNAPVVTLLTITLTAGSTNLTLGGTTQLTVTGNYSDNSHQNLTDESTFAQAPPSFGLINNTGLFTAQTLGTGEVTANLTLNGANFTSNTLTITVTAQALSLLTVSPLNLYSDGTIIETYTLTGSGFAGGDVLQSYLGQITLPGGINPNQLSAFMIFDTAHWDPGWLPFQFVQPPSNTITAALLGNQNVLALSSVGEGFSLETGAFIVHKYKTDMTSDGSFHAHGYAIAVDPVTGNVVVASGDGGALIGVYDENGGVVNAIVTESQSAAAVAASNQIGCAFAFGETTLWCDPDLSSHEEITPISVTIHSDAHNLAMQTTNNQTTGYVFSRPDSTLCWYNIPQMVQVNCVTLTGLSTGSTGFQLVLVNPTTAALLDQAGNTLVFVDVQHAVELRRASIPGTPFRLAAGNSNNALVAISNPGSQLTNFASVDSGTGTVTNLTSTSINLSTGFMLSPVTGKILSTMRAVGEAVPND